jgi:phosphate:Na+ symporter
MKEGFETLKEGIDLAQYAMAGYAGIFVYVLVGAVATVLIQSSSATMAIIITALATGQIDYANALALAIGANIGTTVTAVLGALKSNENGKRLAVAHFIFNITTGVIAITFIYQLAELVDYLAVFLSIGIENYTMKLALFHTIFNIIGVLAVSPFITVLVKYLNTLFVPKGLNKGKAKYLDAAVLALPSTALSAIVMETKHLYENAFDIITHGLNLKKSNLLSSMELDEVIKDLDTHKSIDIDLLYNRWIKDLYGEIIDFSTKAQANMSPEYIEKLYKLKLANRDIVEAVKGTKHLQKNLLKYSFSRNEHIREQYNDIRKGLAELLRNINTIATTDEDDVIILLLSKAKIHTERYDIITNGTLDQLIRKGLITNTMATSLMNDSDYANDISKNLINMAEVLFIDINSDLKKLHEDISVNEKDVEIILDKKG